MRVSQNVLKTILQSNVAEVKFARRDLKPGFPPWRRMLCTNSGELLNSSKGRSVLRYTPPTQRLSYNPDMKNLVITWDIFMQDYRNITVDRCELVSLIPANDAFWEYFATAVIQMTPQDKLEFMKV